MRASIVKADLIRADQLHFPLSAVGTTTLDGQWNWEAL